LAGWVSARIDTEWACSLLPTQNRFPGDRCFGRAAQGESALRRNPDASRSVARTGGHGTVRPLREASSLSNLGTRSSRSKRPFANAQNRPLPVIQAARESHRQRPVSDVQRPLADGCSNGPVLQSSRSRPCCPDRHPMQPVRPQFDQPHRCCRPQADIAISRSYASQPRPVSIRGSLEYAGSRPKVANRKTHMVKGGGACKALIPKWC
jgi:hypothetical protein